MAHNLRAADQRPVIAVIDDDPSILAWAADALAEAGYGTVTAGSRDAAYDALRRRQPAAMLVDLHMEHQRSGWVLLDLILATPALASTPVIVWSADQAQLAARARRMAARGWRWLPKPCGIDLLLQTIQSALHGAPAGAELAGPMGARPARAPGIGAGD